MVFHSCAWVQYHQPVLSHRASIAFRHRWRRFPSWLGRHSISASSASGYRLRSWDATWSASIVASNSYHGLWCTHSTQSESPSACCCCWCKGWITVIVSTGSRYPVRIRWCWRWLRLRLPFACLEPCCCCSCTPLAILSFHVSRAVSSSVQQCQTCIIQPNDVECCGSSSYFSFSAPLMVERKALPFPRIGIVRLTHHPRSTIQWHLQQCNHTKHVQYESEYEYECESDRCRTGLSTPIGSISMG